MNPVKANMVSQAGHYPWSSYRHNALGKADELISVHDLYEQLADTHWQRAQRYKALFDELKVERYDMQITQATYRGEVFGSTQFHSGVDQMISRPTKLISHGGDRKSEDFKNQAG